MPRVSQVVVAAFSSVTTVVISGFEKILGQPYCTGVSGKGAVTVKLGLSSLTPRFRQEQLEQVFCIFVLR